MSNSNKNVIDLFSYFESPEDHAKALHTQRIRKVLADRQAANDRVRELAEMGLIERY